MTIEMLCRVLASRPRLRVQKIIVIWALLVALAPVKMALKVLALPFLFLSNVMWDMGLYLRCVTADIIQELRESDERAENGEEEDEDMEA